MERERKIGFMLRIPAPLWSALRAAAEVEALLHGGRPSLNKLANRILAAEVAKTKAQGNA